MSSSEAPAPAVTTAEEQQQQDTPATVPPGAKSVEGRMERILQRCLETVDAVSGKEIPRLVWKRCAGVAILQVDSAGFVVSMSGGDGVVLRHDPETGKWGPPSAIEFTGLGIGANIGKSDKRIVLFPMTEHALRNLTSDTKYQLGFEAGLAIGPIGREIGIGADFGDKGKGATFSYVMEKGFMVSAGIENNYVEKRSDINMTFYGEHATPEDIVFDKKGAVSIPPGRGVEALHAKLTELSM